MATAQQAVSKARSQVGTTEVGSSNKVKFNDWYWGKGKYGTWAAWCSVFLAWCSDQVGMRKNVDYPYSAGVAECFAWFKAKGRIISKKALKHGDWVRFTFSHTAFFIGYSGRSAIKTVEGNTSRGTSGSQRDGGGVWLRTRPLSLIQYGGRPNYSGKTSTPKPTPSTPTPKKGIFGMAFKTSDRRKELQTVAKGKERVLRTHEKKTWSFLDSIRRGESFLVDSKLTISGLREGQVAEVWLRIGEYVKKSGKGYNRWDYKRVTVYGRPGGGDVHVALGEADKCQISPKHGGELRLYIVAKNVSADKCAVTDVKWTRFGD